MTRARDLGDFIADGAAAELVVDTTTLVVDSTNNRVGIGTASPSQALEVTGTAKLATVDINAGAIDGAVIGANSAAAGTFTALTASGTTTITTADINGGAIDGAIIGANSAAAVTATTLNASTKLQVNGTDVITNARALSNITSIDATTAAAIGAGGVGGGGTVDFTASGSLSNGDLVKLNLNGTVSVLAGGGPGSAVVFESAQINYASATFDSNLNKVVIAYSDTANNYYGTAVVGTVSGTSISFGSPVVFQTVGSNHISATFDTNSNKVVIAYRGASSHGTAIVGTVSGTSISFGTAVVFESAESNFISATFDSNSNKVVIAYQDNGNSNQGTAIVGTVSGTSISFGSHVIFNNLVEDSCSAVFDSNSNKVVIAVKGLNDYGTAAVGTVSGTSISFGSAVVFAIANTSNISATFDSGANKVVIAYQDRGNSNYGTAIVGNVSGTSISFGDEIVFEAATVDSISATFDSSANKVVIAYGDSGNSTLGTLVVAKVSGTSISVGSPSIFVSTAAQKITSTFDSNSNKVVIAYRDSGNSDFGTALTFTPPDASEWVGIASADASNGATATINVVSSVNEGQSSLTVGSRYYITDSGTLTTAFIANREVGRATASTKLFITQGSVS